MLRDYMPFIPSLQFWNNESIESRSIWDSESEAGEMETNNH